MDNYFMKNIKHIREQRGLSQTKLAEMLDVNQTTIARWEDENRIPTIDKAIQVSQILNIPLDELIGKDLRMDNEKTKVLDKLDILYSKSKDILSEESRDIMESIMLRTIENYEKSKNNNE